MTPNPISERIPLKYRFGEVHIDMQIIHLVQRFPPDIGGVENHVFNLARKLSERHKVTVFTFGRETSTGRFDSVDVVRFPFVEINWRTGFTRLSIKMAAELARTGAEIIHAHSYGFTHVDMAARIRRIQKKPILLTAHYDRSPASSKIIKTFRTLYDNFIGIPTLNMADRVIALTEHEKRFLNREFRVDLSKISVIPNGVDLEAFLSPPEPKPLIERYGLKEDQVVLYVGRIDEKKGIQYLIRSAKLVLSEVPRCKYLIVGPDWGALRMLKDMSIREGIAENIIFTGAIPGEELLMAYNLCDLLALPSLGEATGLVVLEAMASKRPVIATDMPVIRELIEQGENGLLVKRGDVEGLAEATVRLLKDDKLKRRMGIEAFNRIKLKDWQHVAEETERLYNDVLSHLK